MNYRCEPGMRLFIREIARIPEGKPVIGCAGGIQGKGVSGWKVELGGVKGEKRVGSRSEEKGAT
jgi:hypothetical protein